MSSSHPDSGKNRSKDKKHQGLPKGYFKAREELSKEINAQMPLKERVEKAVQLAKGVKMNNGTVETDAYTKAPDLKAIEFLENYTTGRPVNVLETDDDTKNALACIIIPAQRPRA